MPAVTGTAAAYAAAYAVLGQAARAWLGIEQMVRGNDSGSDSHRRRERLGRWTGGAPSGPWVWLHASSVGEVTLAAALAGEMADGLGGNELVVTCQTSTGYRRARELHRGPVHYLPLDCRPVLERILEGSAPRLFVAIETEIWPRLLRLLNARGVPTAMANARVSDRSIPRYRWIAPLVSPALAGMSWIGARDSTSAWRLCELGARPAVIEVTGDLKFGMATSRKTGAPAATMSWDSSLPVVVAGSTHEGEEEIVVAAFLFLRARLPAARLVLAPRHPERAASVSALLRARGLSPVLWSERPGSTDGRSDSREGRPGSGYQRPGSGDERPDSERERSNDWTVAVVDEIGHLASLYAAAGAAFVGGSLRPGPGGHNLIEPVLAGAPVSAGPHLANVGEQRDILHASGALVVAGNADDLARTWTDMLEHRPKYQLGIAAARVAIETRRAGMARTAARLISLVKEPSTSGAGLQDERAGRPSAAAGGVR